MDARMADVEGMAPPELEPPPCSPPDVAMDRDSSEYSDQSPRSQGADEPMCEGSPSIDPFRQRKGARRPAPIPEKDHPYLCVAGGKRPQYSNYEHCPTPQSFVRCGPHHRAELCVLGQEEVDQLYNVWSKYRDDLTWPWYDKKPQFSDEDFNTFRSVAQIVVDAMVEEYQVPMVLDQATISNTNHVGHPPHADNVQFDSVWWKGKRIRSEDEVVAAQEGAYVLWRAEKTSYRSYSCSVGLSDPAGYEGGEVQFFEKWGDTDPLCSYKCGVGCGVAFCGCQRNIHAVTGVKSGFRLVLLVWTRPPDVRVPDSQGHVCYFRPGTGDGVWITTADLQRGCSSSSQARKRPRAQCWVPKEKDDENCRCRRCITERKKLAWKDCHQGTGSLSVTKYDSMQSTPTTSAGNSPRTCGHEDGSSPDSCAGDDAPPSPHAMDNASASVRHCPIEQGEVLCVDHKRVELDDVLTKSDVKRLYQVWKYRQDDLSHPWYDSKPEFTDDEFYTFREMAQKVTDAMAAQYGIPMVLDQATISSTNHLGHPPHADNVQFDSVWWSGRQIKQRDELVAARGGATVLWKKAKTSYRSYSASVALSDPSEYGGGDLEFYSDWGEKEPCSKHRSPAGSGVAYCGCQRNIHAVTGVKWGFRLVLLVWTRPPDTQVPEDQAHVCYFRPGTGLSVWLTTADLQRYPTRRRKRAEWSPVSDARKENEESSEGSEEGEVAHERGGEDAAEWNSWEGWGEKGWHQEGWNEEGWYGQRWEASNGRGSWRQD